jgi:hypothetical protein
MVCGGAESSCGADHHGRVIGLFGAGLYLHRHHCPNKTEVPWLHYIG